jgi:hypothetical protein
MTKLGSKKKPKKGSFTTRPLPQASLHLAYGCHHQHHRHEAHHPPPHWKEDRDIPGQQAPGGQQAGVRLAGLLRLVQVEDLFQAIVQHPKQLLPVHAASPFAAAIDVPHLIGVRSLQPPALCGHAVFASSAS